MSSDELDRCPVCLSERKDGFGAKCFPNPNDILDDQYRCDCPVCGGFLISEKAIGKPIETELKGKTHLLSGVLRNCFEKGIKQRILNIEDAKRLVQSAPPSETFLQKRDHLLLLLESQSDNLADLITLETTAYSLIYLHSFRELLTLTATLDKQGYIECEGSRRGAPLVRLTEKGWDKVEQLRQSMPLSDQAFVAMWFDPQMDEAFKKGIRLALRATGYSPLRIDLEEFNDDICDKIRGEIRRSAFVVADFTGNRPGVYFEAGYGMGLGLPVIWTCHKDWMEKVHFDTNHYSHIVWSEPEELKIRLENRIRATLPLRSPLPEDAKDQ